MNWASLIEQFISVKHQICIKFRHHIEFSQVHTKTFLSIFGTKTTWLFKLRRDFSITPMLSIAWSSSWTKFFLSSLTSKAAVYNHTCRSLSVVLYEVCVNSLEENTLESFFSNLCSLVPQTAGVNLVTLFELTLNKFLPLRIHHLQNNRKLLPPCF